jgi:hypothetical protein
MVLNAFHGSTIIEPLHPAEWMEFKTPALLKGLSTAISPDGKIKPHTY